MKRMVLLLSGILLFTTLAYADFNHDIQYVDVYAVKTENLTGPLQLLFDYTGHADGQPAYSGQAVPGVAQGTASWILYKYTYDGSSPANLIQRQTGYGSWTNRASVTYS